MKDKKAVKEKSSIVYEVPCKDCSTKYIGESSRMVGVRMHEHSLDIRNKQIRNHMYVHERDHNHKFDLDNVRVLAQEKRSKPRKFVEGVFSMFSDDHVNNAQDVPTVYLNVEV